MMNILALDTCTELCSVALLYNGQRFEEKTLIQRGHSDLILGMIDTLFQQAGCSIADIDVLAFGRGPGSFTGVRVGVSVAQGIAFARDIPVVGISTLAAVALNAALKHDVTTVAVAMDARMGEIYCAHYQIDGELVHLLDSEKVCPPQDFLPLAQSEWFGAGTAWSVYEAELTQQFGQQLITSDATCLPEASCILRLAESEIAADKFMSAEQALPVYLRDNVAKKKAEQGG